MVGDGIVMKLDGDVMKRTEKRGGKAMDVLARPGMGSRMQPFRIRQTRQAGLGRKSLTPGLLARPVRAHMIF